MRFVDTRHCKSRTHCKTCRNLEGGRAWRLSLAKTFELQGIDFDCPRGLPWGFVGEKPKMTIAELAEKKRNCAPCRKKIKETDQ